MNGDSIASIPTLWSKAEPSQRYFMAQYLVDKDILAHRSRAEIVEILGKETTSSDFSRWVSYNLGRRRFAMDTEPRLVIVFDVDGKVLKYSIISST